MIIFTVDYVIKLSMTEEKKTNYEKEFTSEINSITMHDYRNLKKKCLVTENGMFSANSPN